MEKITYVMALDYVLSNFDIPAEYAERITSLRDATEKRSIERKPTKTQRENVDYKNLIISVLSEMVEPKTIVEIQCENSVLSNLSQQKMTALLRQLILEGRVKREEIAHKPHFSSL